MKVLFVVAYFIGLFTCFNVSASGLYVPPPPPKTKALKATFEKKEKMVNSEMGADSKTTPSEATSDSENGNKMKEGQK